MTALRNCFDAWLTVGFLAGLASATPPLVATSAAVVTAAVVVQATAGEESSRPTEVRAVPAPDSS